MTDINNNKVYSLGAWREITDQFVKVNGTWETVTNVYVKVDGAWKESFPYPLEADATLTALTVNGVNILSSRTINVPEGTTSVTVAATPRNPLSTVTGTGTRSVSFAGNPNSLSVVVTSENEVNTTTYTFTVVVAPPTSVTIYWAYCSGYNPPVTGNQTVSGTTDPVVACNNKKSELGNPANWVCQGTSAPTAPNCGTAPEPPCCTASYTTFDGRVGNTCYYTVYYTDPCTNSTCPPQQITVVVASSGSCPEQ